MRFLGGLLSVLVAVCVAGSAMAADLPTLVKNLVTGGYSERDEAITALAASGEARAEPILQALGAGNLYVRTADSVVVIGKGEGKQIALIDAITGKDAGSAAEDALERVRVNNRLRGNIDAVLGSLTLMSPDPKVRRRAADELFKRRDPGALPALEKALAAENAQYQITINGYRAIAEVAKAGAKQVVDKAVNEVEATKAHALAAADQTRSIAMVNASVAYINGDIAASLTKENAIADAEETRTNALAQAEGTFLISSASAATQESKAINAACAQAVISIVTQAVSFLSTINGAAVSAANAVANATATPWISSA